MKAFILETLIEYNEQINANKSKMNQEEKDNLNRLITTSEIESVT